MQIGIGLGVTQRLGGGSSGGGAGAAVSATYWRVRMFNKFGEVTMSRMELRATSGGADLIPSALSGTATQTPQGGHPVSALSDGDPNTFWGGPSGNPSQTITWIWASPVTIGEIVAAPRNDGFYDQGTTFIVADYSTDSGSTWTPYFMVPIIAWASQGQVKTFTLPTGNSFTGFGMKFSAQSGGGAKVAEFKVATSSGGAQALTGGTAFAYTADGTNTAAKAFDGDAATYYQSSDGSPPHFLAYKDLGAAISAYEFRITAVNDGSNGAAPGASSEFGGSNDAITYKVLKQFTPAAWSAGATQTFTL